MSWQSRTFAQQSTVSRPGEVPAVFVAEDSVPLEHTAALMRLEPANPFRTRSYADAMRANGRQTWLLGTVRSGQLVAGCYGFISSGRLNRSLAIYNLPPDAAVDGVFWPGLLRFCLGHQIHSLELYDLEWSGVSSLPHPGKMALHEKSVNYVLDLADPEREQRLPRNHRRNIRSAEESGVKLRRTRDADACREHVLLMAASHDRRRKRGESVIVGNLKQVLAVSILMVENRAGELFQAVADGQVLSSYLILRAAEGASGLTFGTSPGGMTRGASHFLVHSIARTLHSESVRTFNLGGNDPVPDHAILGLIRFKLGFGATPIPIENATYYFGSDLRRKLTQAARSFRQIELSLLRRISAGRPAI